ncbi:uncharacterized protein LAESUDRAFT_305509 [Laetiporus sulphureus 93-53]|uniref:Uncharacterized protein n=1 Tax=Laetiporus sulphureus 93-53 TaxID=1314785 RepID=A0A165D8P6_9APHY|nr:uncharacterized protein LAESUDRAFT_305509 [Laetiporus sulphureus 93-53]KZT04344.1 hypothetical protein LAESUDRAFT_305509 [Laetiporus sulphureus 93-53]
MLSALRACADNPMWRRQNGLPRQFTSDDVVMERSGSMAADCLRQLRMWLYYNQDIRQFLRNCLYDPLENPEHHC